MEKTSPSERKGLAACKGPRLQRMPYWLGLGQFRARFELAWFLARSISARSIGLLSQKRASSSNASALFESTSEACFAQVSAPVASLSCSASRARFRSGSSECRFRAIALSSTSRW